MRVRDRLVMSYLLIGAMLSIPSFFAVGRLGDLRDLAVRDRAKHAEAALALGAVEAGLGELDAYLRSYVAAPDPSLQQGLFSSLEDLRTQTDRIIRAGYVNEIGALVVELEGLYSAPRESTPWFRQASWARPPMRFSHCNRASKEPRTASGASPPMWTPGPRRTSKGPRRSQPQLEIRLSSQPSWGWSW